MKPKQPERQSGAPIKGVAPECFHPALPPLGLSARGADKEFDFFWQERAIEALKQDRRRYQEHIIQLNATLVEALLFLDGHDYGHAAKARPCGASKPR